MISFEDYEKILTHIGGEKLKSDFHGRKIKIKALGIKIIFEWYANLCNAYIGNIKIHGFNNITISGNWPNAFRTNLELRKNNNIIAIIPIVK